MAVLDLTPQFELLPAEQEIMLPVLPSDAGPQVMGGFQATPNGLQQGQMTLNAIGEQILIGAATSPTVGIGIFMGNDGAATKGYDFRVGDPAGNYMWWDASAATLTIVGAITATSGTIGGFAIGATTISATNFTITSGAANTARLEVGTGATTGGINSANGSSDIIFWGGATFANRAIAPFRVDAAGNLTATSATVSGYILTGKGAFGGDGSDGALSISAGTTTLSAGSAKVLYKNYTSISITGSAKLTISSPASAGTILILKSQGATTITSSSSSVIDMKGMGGAGGAAANDGTRGYGIIDNTQNNGLQGTTSTGGAKGVALLTTGYYTRLSTDIFRKTYAVACGSGGGGSDNAAGGGGGGGLIIESAGAFNFITGTIDCSGQDGAAGSHGGGGGGAAGQVLILYNTLTANTGSIALTGGAGGAGTIAGANSWGGGGGAGSWTAAGGNGGAPGANPGATAAGAGAGGGGGGSNIAGGGAAGSAGATEAGLVAANTVFP